jgi:predicted DNA-binding protein
LKTVTGRGISYKLKRKALPMEVHFTPELEKRLTDLAAQTGRGADELVQDAVAGYMDELAGTRQMLDSRYDDLKSGRVQPIDGEAFFESLRLREDELLNPRTP